MQSNDNPQWLTQYQGDDIISWKRQQKQNGQHQTGSSPGTTSRGLVEWQEFARSVTGQLTPNFNNVPAVELTLGKAEVNKLLSVQLVDDAYFSQHCSCLIMLQYCKNELQTEFVNLGFPSIITKYEQTRDWRRRSVLTTRPWNPTSQAWFPISRAVNVKAEKDSS